MADIAPECTFTVVSTLIDNTTKVWEHLEWSIYQRTPWKYADGTVDYSVFAYNSNNQDETIIGRSQISVYVAILDAIEQIERTGGICG